MKEGYSIGELARVAGVSVRTLHHYDGIGLLAPGSRNASGYRVYGEAELLRLQQILLYRELEVPLERIGAILDAPGHDLRAALLSHRRAIEEKRRRLGLLLSTIDRTVARLGGKERIMTDEELYEGFDKEEGARLGAETKERWGETEAYAQSRERLAKMSKGKWAEVRREGEAVDAACAAALASGCLPDSPAAMRLMARKVAHLRNFYEPVPELFRGLGEMYVSDPRFKANYERLASGLAEWMRAAMAAFADRGMREGSEGVGV